MFIFKSPFEKGPHPHPNPLRRRLVKSAGPKITASSPDRRPISLTDEEGPPQSLLGHVCSHCSHDNSLPMARKQERQKCASHILKRRSKSAGILQKESKMLKKREFEPISLQVVDFSRLTILPFSPKNQSQGEQIIKQEKAKNAVVEQKSILKAPSQKSDKNMSVSFADQNQTFQFSDLWDKIERIALQANLADRILREKNQELSRKNRLHHRQSIKKQEKTYKVIQYGHPWNNNDLHVKAVAVGKQAQDVHETIAGQSHVCKDITMKQNPRENAVVKLGARKDFPKSFLDIEVNQNTRRYHSPRETILALT